MPREFDLQKAIEHRRFDDERLREYLDRLAVNECLDILGRPPDDELAKRITRYHATHDSWKQGDGRPALADDDPGVMQAIGRCAAARIRNEAGLTFGSIHPRPCGWDEYPLRTLLAACEWAQFQSRFVALDLYEWHQNEAKGSPRYVRDGGKSGTYENPRWAAFFALSPEERGRLVERAQYAGVAA